MKTVLKSVVAENIRYEALMFVCPGCIEFGYSGIHMLAVNSIEKKPSWTWDGNAERPTLSPSILTRYETPEKKNVCHSFLRNGVFEFLNDCTHSLAGQKVPMPHLPEWTEEE